MDASTRDPGDVLPGRRTGGIELFRLAGIRVRLDPSWILMFGLVLWSVSAGYFPDRYPGMSWTGYWVAGLGATLLLFLSIVAHEFAHALTAVRNGLRVPSITLFLFGGVSEMEEEPRDPALELRIAAAGPLLSLALALGFYVLHRSLPDDVPSLLAGVISYLAWINTALAVFNLLPGFPLDGGRILRAALWYRWGSLERATRVAAGAGKGLALGLMVLGALQIFNGGLLGGLWLIFIGLFLRGMAAASYESLLVRTALREVRVSDAMLREPIAVPHDTEISKLIDDYILAHGYRAFPVLRGDRPIGVITVNEVRGLTAEQRASMRVEDRMQPIEPRLTIDGHLPLSEALERMERERLRQLLVLEEGRLAGILTRSALGRQTALRRIFSQ